MSLEGWAGDHLEEYRELRSRLEANILPLATSVDGRSFDFQAPLHGLMLPPGGYAILEHGTGERLAQVSRCTWTTPTRPRSAGTARVAGRASAAGW